MRAENAIVLKNVPLPGGRVVTRIFSRERGHVSLVVPRVLDGRPTAAFTRCMQPVELEFEDIPRGGLHRVTSIFPSRDVEEVYGDMIKRGVALLWGEVLCPVLGHEGRNEALHDYLSRSVEYLSAATGGVANFNLFFLYRLCSLLGFRVDVSSYRPGYLFDAGDGRFHAPPPPSRFCADAACSGLIRGLCEDSLESASRLRLDRVSRVALLDAALLFIGLHLDVSFDTKALRVVRSIFSDGE
ncbi:MAG: recombination protein O N-terminal domain-containing protein [Odoribacteraceae bacterium]|jgi:DNA repair protein RecO (recombination protein O)|nr:recombination protein O N-terminal domain-containing protein [Odoribacteraceae bacterium]